MTTLLFGDTPDRPTVWPDTGEMHFRLIDDGLGALDMSCDTGYIVRQYDLGFPAVREVSYENSLDDGTYDQTQFVGARAVTLDVMLRPTQNIDGTGVQYSAPRMRDALFAYLHPGRRPMLYFSEHGDDRVKQVQLRGSQLSAPMSQPRFNAVNAGWVAPFGLIESYQLHYVTAYLDEAAGDFDFPVQNDGNVGAHWQIEILGEITTPRFMLDGNTDMILELEYESEIGDTVIIDSFTKTVSINGVPVGYRYLNDNSSWFTIPPGSHVINVDHDSTVRAGYPYLFWEGSGLGVASFGPLVAVTFDENLLNTGSGTFGLELGSVPSYSVIPAPGIPNSPGASGLVNRITVLSGTSIDANAGAETTAAFVYIPDGRTSGDAPAGLWSTGDSENGSGLYIDGMTLLAVTVADGLVTSTLTHTLPTDDTTYHVAVSHGAAAGDQHVLYVNGAAVDTETLGAGHVATGLPQIGGYSGREGTTALVTNDGEDLVTTDGSYLVLTTATDALDADIDGTGIIIGEFLWTNQAVDPSVIDAVYEGQTGSGVYSEDGPGLWADDPPHDLPGDPGVPPPWAWTPDIDPSTGEPAVTEITVYWRDTWI